LCGLYIWLHGHRLFSVHHCKGVFGTSGYINNDELRQNG
jgi:hypothetical protein